MRLLTALYILGKLHSLTLEDKTYSQNLEKKIVNDMAFKMGNDGKSGYLWWIICQSGQNNGSPSIYTIGVVPLTTILDLASKTMTNVM